MNLYIPQSSLPTAVFGMCPGRRSGPALLTGFALDLLYTSHPAKTEGPPTAPPTAPLRSPSLIVRSLMPSFRGFVNLFGLFRPSVSVPLAAFAIAASLLC
jgi:hypothetical protein